MLNGCEEWIKRGLDGSFMRYNGNGTFTLRAVPVDYLPPYGLPEVSEPKRNRGRPWNTNARWTEREVDLLMSLKMDNQPFEVIRETLRKGRPVIQAKLKELKEAGVVFPPPKRRVPDSMSIEFREKVVRLREAGLTKDEIVEALNSSYYKVDMALKNAERVTVHGRKRAA